MNTFIVSHLSEKKTQRLLFIYCELRFSMCWPNIILSKQGCWKQYLEMDVEGLNDDLKVYQEPIDWFQSQL